MKLFKYFPPERETFFEDGLIRLTQPMFLNDPFECVPKMPNVEDFKFALLTELDKLDSTLPGISNFAIPEWEIINHDFLNEKIRKAQESLNRELGIFSLSKYWNNVLMWSHYAQNHQGFCLEFDCNHEFFKDHFSDGGKRYKIMKSVVYSSIRPNIRMSTETPLSYDIFITKNNKWKYEHEVRLFVSLNQADVIKGENIYLFKVPNSAVKSVIIGANAKNELKEKIIQFGKLHTIKTYEIVVSNESFVLKRKLIR